MLHARRTTATEIPLWGWFDPRKITGMENGEERPKNNLVQTNLNKTHVGGGMDSSASQSKTSNNTDLEKINRCPDALHVMQLPSNFAKLLIFAQKKMSTTYP